MGYFLHKYQIENGLCGVVTKTDKNNEGKLLSRTYYYDYDYFVMSTEKYRKGEEK